MKHYSKKLIMIFAGAVIGIGVVLGAVGFAMADFDLDTLNGREEERFSGDYPLTNGLSVDIEDANLRFTTTAADEIHINGEDVQLEVTQRTDGVLSVQQVKKQRKWYELLMVMDWGSPVVEIALPQAFQGSLQIEQGNGSLEMNQLRGITEIAVEKKDGKLQLADLAISGSCSLRQNYGSVLVERVTAESLHIDRKDGNLDLRQVDITGALMSKGSYGKIRFEEVTAADCRVDGKDINVNLAETRISGELKVYMDYGDLVLEKATAGLLECDMKDGSVTGTLLGGRGDYRSSVELKDGKNNLETRHDGAREIKIQIDYGDVRLDFEEG